MLPIGKHIAIPLPHQRRQRKAKSVRLGDLALGHAGLAADARIDRVFACRGRHDLVLMAGQLGIGVGSAPGLPLRRSLVWYWPLQSPERFRDDNGQSAGFRVSVPKSSPPRPVHAFAFQVAQQHVIAMFIAFHRGLGTQRRDHRLGRLGGNDLVVGAIEKQDRRRAS